LSLDLLLIAARRQSGRNIAAPSKYFNRQGKHLPDTSAGQKRGVRQVEAGDAEGQRIDNFLLGEMTGVPRSRVYGMLRKGEVRVNGGRIKPDYRLKAADIVRIPPWHGRVAGQVAPPSRGLLDELAGRILYQDAGVIVVDKPAGTAVHGGSGIEHGVIEAFRALFPDEQGLELAHRLDRDTSGCLVLARNRRALLELHTAFRDAVVAKTYDVLVYGAWPKKLRTVRAHLEKFVTKTGERRVRVLADGKSARTEFVVVESGERASWIKAHPHTGRTHQIRVHSQVSGHPVVGDEKYASAEQLARSRVLGVRRLCLHASSVTLPIEGRMRRFDAALPADFADAWQRLRDSDRS
jgi:23S rRNA pseudouridine955/2504/2580 synthase